MKKMFLPLCILLLTGCSQLYALAYGDCYQHTSSVVASVEIEGAGADFGQASVGLMGKSSSSDRDKAVIKMLPTEITEEEEDEHQLISFEYPAVFFVVQSPGEFNETLRLSNQYPSITSSRRYLVYRVFRI